MLMLMMIAFNAFALTYIYIHHRFLNTKADLKLPLLKTPNVNGACPIEEHNYGIN